MADNHRFDWRRVPGEVASRTKAIWSASLGIAQAVEQKGEEIFEAVTGDRAALMDRIQDTGSKALDDLQTEANRVFEDLVARGERLQKDGFKAVEKATTQLAQRPKALADDMVHAAENAVASVMQRMDVPSRTELAKLADRVERLTREVQRLASRLAGEETEPDVLVLEVASVTEGWVVREAHSGVIRYTAETKADAVREARDIAKAAVPSELRILKLDGSVQDVAHYGEPEPVSKGL